MCVISSPISIAAATQAVVYILIIFSEDAQASVGYQKISKDVNEGTKGKYT